MAQCTFQISCVRGVEVYRSINRWLKKNPGWRIDAFSVFQLPNETYQIVGVVEKE